MDSYSIRTLTSFLMEGAGAVITIVLTIMFINKKIYRGKEERIFLILSIITTLLSIVNFIGFVIYGNDEDPNVLEHIIYGINTLLMLFLSVWWLIFVTQMLYGNIRTIECRKSFIKKTFLTGVVLTVLFSALDIILYLNRDTFSENFALLLGLISLAMELGADFIYLRYIVMAYQASHKDLIQRKLPVFLKLTPFVVPVLGGQLIRIVTTYSTSGIGYALGLIWICYVMSKRHRYMNTEKGCYNSDFLPYLDDFFKKEGIDGCSALWFKTDTVHEDRFLDILRSWKPDNSEIVYCQNGGFLLVSEEQPQSAVEMMSDLIKNDANEAGFSVISNYGKKESGEKSEDFYNRVKAATV